MRVGLSVEGCGGVYEYDDVSGDVSGELRMSSIGGDANAWRTRRGGSLAGCGVLLFLFLFLLLILLLVGEGITFDDRGRNNPPVGFGDDESSELYPNVGDCIGVERDIAASS